jgi:hypothetical protein
VATQPSRAPTIPLGSGPDSIYARWFVWARQLGHREEVSHLAAAAALQAGARNEDPLSAAEATLRSPGRSTPSVPDRLRELCYWYQWAVEEKLTEPNAMETASAAARSVALGMTRLEAADVAIAYSRGDRSVQIGLLPIDRFFRDPGFVSVIFACIVFTAAVFIDRSIVGVVVAMGAGLGSLAPLYGARFQGRLTRLMGVALLINAGSFAVLVVRSSI